MFLGGKVDPVEVIQGDLQALQDVDPRLGLLELRLLLFRQRFLQLLVGDHAV